ncbi:MAG: hypothetical protein ACE5HL_01580 [Terriglobia bacterium]
MGRINWGRVILGGFAAGVIMNVVESISNGVILGKAWSVAVAQLDHTMEIGPGTLTALIIRVFVLAVLAVWLYAAIRPRYGPGPKTAVFAGLAVWLLSYLFTATGHIIAGLFPPGLNLASAGLSLVGVVAGTLLGGWFYKEA